MTISEYIENIVNEALPTATYCYARNHDFNILGDGITTNVVLCIEPDQGFFNLNSTSGNLNKGYNLFIRFLQTIPDASVADFATKRDAEINQQEQNAAIFLMRLSNDDRFIDLRTPIPIVRVVEAYDGKWYGAEINLNNLQFLIPEDVC